MGHLAHRQRLSRFHEALVLNIHKTVSWHHTSHTPLTVTTTTLLKILDPPPFQCSDFTLFCARQIYYILGHYFGQVF